MTLIVITAATPTADIERARAFLRDETFERGMALASHLGAALAEVLRLRAQLGETLGAKFKCRRITLCGSARFARAYREWMARLMVEQSAMVWSAPLIPGLTKDAKERIDEIWFAQIAASDGIFVLDVGGYIGESTAEEIAFATERGIGVRYLSKEAPGWTEADCRFAPEAVDRAEPSAGPDMILVPEWVCRLLWETLPWGAAKGELLEGEMKLHAARWAGAESGHD